MRSTVPQTRRSSSSAAASLSPACWTPALTGCPSTAGSLPTPSPLSRKPFSCNGIRHWVVSCGGISTMRASRWASSPAGAPRCPSRSGRSRRDDGLLHRCRTGGRGSDHGAGPAAAPALPGVPLCRFDHARGSARAVSGGRPRRRHLAAAAAVLPRELTVPGVAQTVTLSRVATLSTAMPPGEDLTTLSTPGATLVLHLAAAQIDTVVPQLLDGGYRPETPCAVVAFVSWPQQQVLHGTLGGIAGQVHAAGITRTAVIVVGDILTVDGFADSYLYSPSRRRTGRH